MALPLEDWPELPPVPPSMPDLPVVPDNPTHDELQRIMIDTLRALGSTLVGFGQLWPRTVQALEYIKAWTVRHQHLHDLPPMRGKMDSTLEASKGVGEVVAKAYEAELKNPSTPPIPLPSTIAELVDGSVAAALERVKRDERAAAWERLEGERKQAETDRLADLAASRARTAALELVNAKERIKFKWAALLAVLSAIAGTIVWALEHFGHAH